MVNQGKVKVNCPTGSYPILMQSPVNYNQQQLLAVIKLAKLVKLLVRTLMVVYSRMTMTRMIRRGTLVPVLVAEL